MLPRGRLLLLRVCYDGAGWRGSQWWGLVVRYVCLLHSGLQVKSLTRGMMMVVVQKTKVCQVLSHANYIILAPLHCVCSAHSVCWKITTSLCKMNAL